MLPGMARCILCDERTVGDAMSTTRVGREARIEVKCPRRKRTLTRGEASCLGLVWAFDALQVQDALGEITLTDGRRIRRVNLTPLTRQEPEGWNG